MTHETVVTGFPETSSPVVDQGGRLTRPWLEFFRGLWNASGGSGTESMVTAFVHSGVLVLVVDGAEYPVISGTVDVAGNVTVNTKVEGTSPQVVIMGISPQTYSATRQGTLAVSKGTIELSRNNGVNYYLVSTDGGAVPVLVGDLIRMTWTGAQPQVTFFPGGA